MFNNPFRFSVSRINKTLELYLLAYGKPDRIVYNTIIWDVLGYFDNNKEISQVGFGIMSPQFNSTLISLKKNVVDRLFQIESIVGPNIDICLRTAG